MHESYLFLHEHSYIRCMLKVYVTSTQSFGNLLSTKQCTCFKLSRVTTRNCMNIFKGQQYSFKLLLNSEFAKYFKVFQNSIDDILSCILPIMYFSMGEMNIPLLKCLLICVIKLTLCYAFKSYTIYFLLNQESLM